MTDKNGVDPQAVARLYNLAFAQYRTRALWNMRQAENPTPGDALAITRSLRVHGGMDGRRLAEQIETLCKVKRAGGDSAAY